MDMGLALFHMERYEEAIASLEKALAVNPDSHEAYFHLGNILCAVDRNEEAIANYCRALGAKPDFPEAHQNLARASRRAKRTPHMDQWDRRMSEITRRYPRQ